MKKRLDELFMTKPKADIVVKAVEKFREKSAGKAFYQQPAPDGSRPGMFYVNLANMKSMPTYELEALAYHEGIPGHHMQIAIAQELHGHSEIPEDGFALHRLHAKGGGSTRELIPKEMGLYQDPYSDFGRLSLELWRAGRLVVDTGIHHKRWTRAAGDRLPEEEHAERRGRLRRSDQSLHRHAEPGDRLQDRDDQDSRAARESEEAARREVRSPAVPRSGPDERPRSARYAGGTGRSLGEVETGGLALRVWIAILSSLISSRFFITLSLASPRSSLSSRYFIQRSA